LVDIDEKCPEGSDEIDWAVMGVQMGPMDNMDMMDMAMMNLMAPINY